MPMPDRGFQLVILPDRRMDWRTLATSYGLEVLFILILVNISIFMPDEIKMRQNYHITELIPRPSLRPEKIKPKPLPTRAKLLPAAPIEKPHLIVTREIRPPKIQAPPPQEIEPPKVAMNNFAPAVIKPIVNALKGGSALTYLETNGIIDAGIFYLIGIVIYFVMRARAVRAGVDEKMLFTELPPD